MILGALCGFAELCRANGLRVSPAETMDAARAIALLPLDQPQQIRAALAATLCKRSVDQELFAELWRLGFEHRWDNDDGEAPLVVALRRSGLSADEIEAVLALLADEAARLSPLARGLGGLRRGTIESLLLLGGLSVQAERLASALQSGFVAHQIWNRLSGPLDELRLLEKRLATQLSAEQAERVRRAMEAELNVRRLQLRQHLDEGLAARTAAALRLSASETPLLDRPIGALSERELGELRRELQRLGVKLRTVARLQHTRRARGRIDIARTLRRALSTGGVPMRIVYKRLRRTRPRLVVLCDLSDSVRHVARFMLELCYSVQELFADVRSFVFVSDVVEATELFADHPLDRAVDLASHGRLLNVFANSNYGRVLRRFSERSLDLITSRTTVVIIGDGRNNYHPAEAWALRQIADRARRVVWLNPEPPASWAFGDSAMREYEPLCKDVAYANNLSTLVKFVDGLVRNA